MARRRIIQVALNLDRDFDRRVSESIDARRAWMGISALLREALAQYLFDAHEHGEIAHRSHRPADTSQDMPRDTQAGASVGGPADQTEAAGDLEEIEDIFGEEIAITRSATT